MANSISCGALCLSADHICCGTYGCPAGQGCGADGTCVVGGVGATVPASGGSTIVGSAKSTGVSGGLSSPSSKM